MTKPKETTGRRPPPPPPDDSPHDATFVGEVMIERTQLYSPPSPPPTQPNRALRSPSSPATGLPTAPLLRTDLVVVSQSEDLVTVRRPESRTQFPIYRMEWRIAQLMDGNRSLTAIAQAASHAGMPATADLVRSFVRELRGYGFLAEDQTSGTDRSADLREAIAAAESDEERQLLRTALTMETSGNDRATAAYLEAALQVEPRNAAATAALRARRQAPRRATIADAVAATDGLVFDIDEPDETRVGVPPSQRRNTTVDEIAPSPPPPQRGSLRLVVVALSIALIVVSGVAVAVVWSQRNLARQLAELDKRTETARPTEAKAQPKVVIQATFTPAERIAISAPRAGIWANSLINVGDQVASEAVLGTIVDAKLYPRLARAQKRYNRMKDQARFDDVYKFFLAEAKAQLANAERDAKGVQVLASSAGTIEALPEVGKQVEVGSQVVSLLTPASLATTIASSAAAVGGSGPLTCRIPDHADVSCALTRSGEQLQIKLRDELRALDFHKPVTVIVEPAP